MENPWRAPAIHPSTEVNFVKPPMVDREGVIMCPNDVNMFGVPSKFYNYCTQGRGLNFINVGKTPLSNSTTDGLNRLGEPGPDTGFTFTSIFSESADDTYRNYHQLWNPVPASTDVWTGSAAPGNIRSSCWANAIDNTYVTCPVPKTLMQDKNKLNEQGIKKYRLQDYFLFLANVKNIYPLVLHQNKIS